MYQAQVRYDDRVLEVTWDNGKISGDPFLVAVLTTEAKVREGTSVGPPGNVNVFTNHLQSGLSTFELLRDVFGEENVEMSGEFPGPLPDEVLPPITTAKSFSDIVNKWFRG